MLFVPSGFYARWCFEADLAGLRECPTDPPPEKLLQAVWQHQHLQRDALKLTDGRPVRILHPGFWNHEAGPDFRDAVIQVDGARSISGPIEVDLSPEDWRAHKHDQNPDFAGVILHVVWQCKARPARPATPLPTLELKAHLAAPWATLVPMLFGEEAGALPESLAGQCCPPLRQLAADETRRLLDEAALARLQLKAAQLQTRAQACGREQALWEGLFRALGYKHNSWPMHSLAERRLRYGEGCRAPLHWQARLMGAAGLLPLDLSRQRPDADVYVRKIWDIWWRERDGFADEIMPSGIWRLAGLRPANHPQRRLALAAHWLAGNSLADRLQRWMSEDLPAAKAAASLLKTLQGQPDEFWTWHWTLRSARLPKPQPLLGAARVTDLAMNVILPWFWLQGVEDQNDPLRQRVERLYLSWPAGDDNAVLKLARKRLLGQTSPGGLKTAAAQQGLLQIVRDFCQKSNSLCESCRFPDLVRQWQKQQRP